MLLSSAPVIHTRPPRPLPPEWTHFQHRHERLDESLEGRRSAISLQRETNTWAIVKHTTTTIVNRSSHSFNNNGPLASIFLPPRSFYATFFSAFALSIISAISQIRCEFQKSIQIENRPHCQASSSPNLSIFLPLLVILRLATRYKERHSSSDNGPNIL